MPIQLEFLDARRAALDGAVEFLARRYLNGHALNLGDVVVVLPGARASRRLRELLLAYVEDREYVYWPPKIITVGRLPEFLYEPKKVFATELVQNAVWARTLKTVDRSIVSRVAPHAPGARLAEPGRPWGDSQWLDLGTLFCSQYRALAAEGLSFADVAETLVAATSPREEVRRWEALAIIQTAYLDRLDELDLWDRQTARLVAVRKKEIEIDGAIVLVGTADLNRLLRQMLDQVADRVTALVHAPKKWQSRFDPYGCLRPDAWTDTTIDIRESQIEFVDGPADQAAAVAQRIADHNRPLTADDIVIGCPDEELVPSVQRELAKFGLEGRWGGGRRLRDCGPLRLLAATEELVRDASVQSFAALVRHPDVGTWLERSGVTDDWLTTLDRYIAACLPGRWLDLRRCGDQPLATVFQRIRSRTAALFREHRPVAQWAEAIGAWILDIYGDWELDREDQHDRQTLRALEAIHSELMALADLPTALSMELTAADALRMVLARCDSQSVAMPPGRDMIEMMGWLELPLDDAPLLIITSMNDRYVPSSVQSDLFLPNTVRQNLGIDDNDRRYARDAYALSTILLSRPHVHLIAARRSNNEGDPELPSRLFFADDDLVAARRALEFFAEGADEVDAHELDAVGVNASAATSAAAAQQFFGFKAATGFQVPRPRPLAEPITRLSPTRFKSFLACPYRFYLRHVLKLEEINDDVFEMDGRVFGNLAHEVLRQFGESDVADAEDEKVIERFFNIALDKEVHKQFGRSPLATVRVQQEQLRLRLRAFAAQQAAHAVRGWRIQNVESSAEVTWSVDDEAFVIHGKIDRIDYNSRSNGWAIYDYKTGDSGIKPDAAHRTGGRRGKTWVDLQLPLYRHLARALGVDGEPELGYIVLPKSTDATGFEMAGWSLAELAEADAQAEEVIRRVRDEEFWPPTFPPPKFSQWAAAICLDGVQERPEWAR